MRSQEREDLTPGIIFEDDEIVVVDKPAGWIVNDAATAKGQPTIQDWLRENFKFPIFNSLECRNGIVHRLDKETSGILLVAKNKNTFEYLQSQFKERGVKKSYTALLHGKLEKEEGIIEAEVGRLPWNRRRFGVLPGGRYSKTKYKVREILAKDKESFSLVDFYPETGRTHQIRIHARHIGHPIVGDEFYAGRKTARNDRKWCPRLFLHASEITFTHRDKEITFQSDLATDLETVLHSLEKYPQAK